MAGVARYQRQLASDVRDLTLKEIKAILCDEKTEVYGTEFKKQVILKLASNVLPRINEHSGPDGEPMQFVPIYGGASISKYPSDKKDIQPEEKD